jgi:hypothetical protein
MSVIWSGITEGGQIVPIQVDEQGRVISTASAPDPLWIEESGNLRPANPGATIVSDGAIQTTGVIQGKFVNGTEKITGQGVIVSRGSGDQSANTVVGEGAFSLGTTGNSCTVVGYRCAYWNKEGKNNTAMGDQALNRNEAGSDNTAIGYKSLLTGVLSTSNTAVGSYSLYSNDGSKFNTAVGESALKNNVDGDGNTGVGRRALQGNKTGANNTGLGLSVLQNQVSGTGNTALGSNSLLNVESSSFNTGAGTSSLYKLSEGQKNVGVGYQAGRLIENGSNNTFIGGNQGIAELSDTVCISAGSQARIWIDNTGNCGIGTTNPQADLDIAGPALFANGLCGFLDTGELFFRSRNNSYKLVVASNGLVSAEPIDEALLGLDQRIELDFPSET